MRIVFFVAGNTVALQFDLENWLDMAGLALYLLMGPDQLVPGFAAMIETYGLPAVVRMAAAALFAIVPLVIVIFAVAANAICFQRISKRIFAVAFTALELCMLAQKPEVGVAAVACGGRVAEGLVFMAITAAWLPVLADQRKVGLVVIEFDFLPVDR